MNRFAVITVFAAPNLLSYLVSKLVSPQPSNYFFSLNSSTKGQPVQMRLLEASQAGNAAQVRLLLAQGYAPDKDQDDVSDPVSCILNKRLKGVYASNVHCRGAGLARYATRRLHPTYVMVVLATLWACALFCVCDSEVISWGANLMVVSFSRCRMVGRL